MAKFSIDADLEIKSEKPLLYKCDFKGAFRHEITWTADVAVQPRQESCRWELTARTNRFKGWTRQRAPHMNVIKDNNMPRQGHNLAVKVRLLEPEIEWKHLLSVHIHM